jgi:hypothetical protein
MCVQKDITAVDIISEDRSYVTAEYHSPTPQVRSSVTVVDLIVGKTEFGKASSGITAIPVFMKVHSAALELLCRKIECYYQRSIHF